MRLWQRQNGTAGTDASLWQGLAVHLSGRNAYRPVWRLQQQLWEQRHSLRLPDLLLLLEHAPVLTLGRHGDARNARRPSHAPRPPRVHRTHDVHRPGVDGRARPQERLDLVRVDRGGDVTYHGPGQLVAYPICDLRARSLAVRAFVAQLEGAVIDVLAEFGVRGERRAGLTGVWVRDAAGWAKIAALGVRVARHVSRHGVALNVGDCLAGFAGIVPCGLPDARVITLAQLCPSAGLPAVAERLEAAIAARLALDLRRLHLPPLQTEEDVAPRLEAIADHAHRAGRRPAWLRVGLPGGADYARVRRTLRGGRLLTVCESARCPNRHECWNAGTATFLVLGERCTRSCRFCAVPHGAPKPPQRSEIERVVAAAERLDLRHLVVTSVTRDDLTDGGAGHFAEIVRTLRLRRPQTTCEVLIPDFAGDLAALERVLAARPTVLNHNVETVPRLYPAARPRADYRRSLEILRRASEAGLRTKSGLMVGLGESDDEIAWLLRDLRQSGCARVTIGQYLQPTRQQLPVKRYLSPAAFAGWQRRALAMGFEHVAAGPLVRSSYRAAEGLGTTVGCVARA
ncbi:MAG: lipoyl synthase [Candidatus Eisenbacteria bacterium]|nr:lipoyl synthase [Candidatus Eisenbacteria bacterium]